MTPDMNPTPTTTTPNLPALHPHGEPETVTEAIKEYTDPDLREKTEELAEDLVAEVVPLMPIVLPVMGGVLMFLLAFIAIYMA